MTIIDCKPFREKILDEVRDAGYKDLKLSIIQVSDDPASAVYVKNKVKTAESVGIITEVVNCRVDMSLYRLRRIILRRAGDPSVTGIILQLPLPPHLQQYERDLIDLIPPEKDVDGLTTANIGLLWADEPCIVPATPGGIMRLLPEDLSGKNVTIVNRSDLIGKPLTKLLLDRNATVTVCHSKTDIWSIKDNTQCADFIITAVGKPNFFNTAYISDIATWIDCGINRDENGRLCGDVDRLSAEMFDIGLTPVPGGVGILTTAQLMANVVKARKLQEYMED